MPSAPPCAVVGAQVRVPWRPRLVRRPQNSNAFGCTPGCTLACRFADRLDAACMLVGLIGAGATGAAMPLFSILFGDL